MYKYIIQLLSAKKLSEIRDIMIMNLIHVQQGSFICT